MPVRYSEPSWLADSSRALLNDEHNGLAHQVVAAAIGADHNSLQGILHDGDARPAGEAYSTNIADPELSPAGDKLAALRGQSHETLRFYDMRGATPAISPRGLSQPVGGSAASPTWAPDGAALAWAEGDGIWTTALFVNDRGGAGRYTATWTVRGRTVATAAFRVRAEPSGG